MTILAPDTLSERTANCYELLGLAEEVQDDTIRFDAAFHRGGTALEAGDAEAANDMVELAARVAGSLHQPRFLWQARLMQTAQAVFRGSLDDAEFFADEALDLGRRAGQNADAFVFHTEQTFEIERWRGNLAEHIEELRPFAGQPAWDFGYVLTRYLYEAGDTVAASEIYRRIVATTFLPLRRDMLAAPALYNLALLATRERDRATAEGLYTALQPFADAFANTTVAKPVGWHYLGMLAATTGRTVAADPTCARRSHSRHGRRAAVPRRERSRTGTRVARTGRPRRGRTTPCQCRRHRVLRARRRLRRAGVGAATGAPGGPVVVDGRRVRDIIRAGSGCSRRGERRTLDRVPADETVERTGDGARDISTRDMAAPIVIEPADLPEPDEADIGDLEFSVDRPGSTSREEPGTPENAPPWGPGTLVPLDFPDRLVKRGLQVAVIKGWETRGKPADHRAGVLHHTASNLKTTPKATVAGHLEGKPDVSGPLCNVTIGRDGVVYVLARLHRTCRQDLSGRVRRSMRRQGRSHPGCKAQTARLRR